MKWEQHNLEMPTIMRFSIRKQQANKLAFMKHHMGKKLPILHRRRKWLPSVGWLWRNLKMFHPSTSINGGYRIVPHVSLARCVELSSHPIIYSQRHEYCCSTSTAAITQTSPCTLTRCASFITTSIDISKIQVVFFKHVNIWLKFAQCINWGSNVSEI